MFNFEREALKHLEKEVSNKTAKELVSEIKAKAKTTIFGPGEPFKATDWMVCIEKKIL